MKDLTLPPQLAAPGIFYPATALRKFLLRDQQLVRNLEDVTWLLAINNSKHVFRARSDLAKPVTVRIALQNPRFLGMLSNLSAGANQQGKRYLSRH